jgi:hypothetical protein
VQREVDRSGYAIGVAKHVVIPKPDDAITLGLYGPRTVHVLSWQVLPTIHFNNQLCAVTAEIDGVAQQRHLTPEASLREAGTENSPHPTFRVGCIAAEAPRPLGRTEGGAVSNHLQSPSPPPPQPSPIKREGVKGSASD